MKPLPQTLLALRALCPLFAAALLLATGSRALADVHYVDLNSTNSTPPYTDWTTAATNIQDAVDAAVTADEVVVTNGMYHPVGVHTSLKLRSVNGPQFTAINGGGSVQCVYLTNSATLSGFTLTNGSRGVLAASWTATVSNCVISGNASYASGGGAYGVTLNNCILSGNWAFLHGGGAAWCNLNNCRLIGNSTDDAGAFDADRSPEGGAAWYCTLNNCVLVGNSATRWVSEFNDQPAYGGGASSCTLNNCTLTGNYVFATDLSGASNRVVAYGGGAFGSTLNNCVLDHNWIALYQTNNYYGGSGGAANCTMRCCLFGMNLPGSYDYRIPLDNCSFADPMFVDYAGGNLRLQSNSPCINAGNNSCVTNLIDLDGNPRIAGGTVDIGAYEFQSPASRISYAWLQQYGLPINDSTDTADPDGDAVDNYHEWLAATNPTNALSSPAQLTITSSGVPPSGTILTWSTNAVGFTLQSTTNLPSPAAWVTNSPAPIVVNGQNTVTNPITAPQQFYRLLK